MDERGKKILKENFSGKKNDVELAKEIDDLKSSINELKTSNNVNAPKAKESGMQQSQQQDSVKQAMDAITQARIKL